ncbi:MAG: 7-carboxy-7-deazaguanine synthase [Pseudomonadota bacterium]
MTYTVKEIFYTLQGEGIRAGRPAVFCRFTGCNLWSGREKHRANAICQFCDTDFVGIDGAGGGKFKTADELVKAISEKWPGGGAPYVVCTGGEPLLQLDSVLINALHRAGFEIALETNGTLPAPSGIDWICMSPKAHAELKLKHGNELKLVYPQLGVCPTQFEKLDFEHFLLQPMDNDKQDMNTQKALQYCLQHPRWRLSLQTHKTLNIP